MRPNRSVRLVLHEAEFVDAEDDIPLVILPRGARRTRRLRIRFLAFYFSSVVTYKLIIPKKNHAR